MMFAKRTILLFSSLLILYPFIYFMGRMFSGEKETNLPKPKIREEQQREDRKLYEIEDDVSLPEIRKEQPQEDRKLYEIQDNVSLITEPEQPRHYDTNTYANQEDAYMIKNPEEQTADDMITYATREDVYMVNGASVLVAMVYDLPDTDSTLLRSLKLYLKSLAIFNKERVDIIFVMNKNEYKIREIIKDWPESYRTRLNITIVQPWFPSTIFNEGFNRKGGVEKLLLAQMFPRLNYALYTDVDVAFLRPVSDLFREFDTFNAAQFIGGAGLTSFCPMNLRMCYNAGFILMNLTRMRDYPVYFPSLILDLMGSKGRTDDQKLFNTIIKTKPKIFKALPVEWDIVLMTCVMKKRFPKKVLDFDGWSMIHGSRGMYFNNPSFTVVTKPLEHWEMGSNVETLVEEIETAAKALVKDNSTKVTCDRDRLIDWVTYYPKKTLLS